MDELPAVNGDELNGVVERLAPELVVLALQFWNEKEAVDSQQIRAANISSENVAEKLEKSEAPICISTTVRTAVHDCLAMKHAKEERDDETYVRETLREEDHNPFIQHVCDLLKKEGILKEKGGEDS
jgi:hypothetical protein